MADSRQTKIVSYKLQGDASDLLNEIQAAVQTLDALDRKFTKIAADKRMVGGKDVHNFARAAAISSTETQIGNIKNLLNPENIETVSPDQLNLLKHMNAELKKQIDLLNKFKSEQTISTKAIDKTRSSLNQVHSALKKSNIVLPKTTNAWRQFTQAITKAQTIISVIKMLINYMNQLYEKAGDFVEVMNLFNVATQESSKELYALAESMEQAYNTDIGPILNSIAVFRQYANTMGFAAEQADILSEYLTKVTYDLASLYNVANKDMMKAVKSGLAGQTKPLMQYGISVHKATLEQYALNLGLEKSWSAFTETEKVALRYIAILDQASLAQGDLAKTLESPANQLKITKAQLEVFVRNLGTAVVIISKYVLPVFNGLLIAVNAFTEAMNRAAGYEIPDYSNNLSENNQMLDEGAESAEEYEDAIQGLLAPLDEINQVSDKDNNVVGGIDPKILDALQGYDNLMSQINTKTDMLAAAFENLIPEQFAKGFGSTLGLVFTTFGDAVTVVTQALETLSPPLALVLNLLGYLLQGVSWLVGNVASPVLAFIEVLTSNIWLLIAAFAALNLAQLAVTGNWKSMIAVKIITMFKNLTVAITKNTTALVINAAKAIASAAASAKNTIAKWIEAGAYWRVAVAAIAATGAMALVVTGIVLAATAAAESQASKSMNSGKTNVPALASGAVVNAPTLALIGEGRYDEAVVPLGNSPQFKTMKDDIANEVVRKINPYPRSAFGQPMRQSVPVILNLNGREVARAILPDIGYVQPQTGVRLSR